jgi:alpha-galactosidase
MPALERRLSGSDSACCCRDAIIRYICGRRAMQAAAISTPAAPPGAPLPPWRWRTPGPCACALGSPRPITQGLCKGALRQRGGRTEPSCSLALSRWPEGQQSAAQGQIAMMVPPPPPPPHMGRGTARRGTAPRRAWAARARRLSMLLPPLLAVVLVSLPAGNNGQPARKTPAQIAPYPPMQFHSFGEFKKHDEINEANMLGIARSLLSSGMAAAGYDTINVVCNGWVGRNATTGQLLENRTLWPNGIQGLATKLHGMSPPLKLGCYTAPREKNCMCNRLWAGGPCEEGTGPGHEATDMAFFAASGCDHVMVDMPDGPATAAAFRARYRAIGDGIRESSNPNMLFGVWSGPLAYSWKWAAATGGHYWRIGDDIYDGWQSLMRMWDTLQSIPNIAHRTKPGAYTFLDQMLIGDVPGRVGTVTGPGLTYDEAVAHMSLWVMAASPLLACTDPRNMSAAIKDIWMNNEILAVHKDPLARMALRVDIGGGHEAENANFCPATYPTCQRLGPDDSGYHGPCKVCRTNSSVWEKPLADNSSAVMVLNRGETRLNVTVLLYDLADNTYNRWVVRDIWAKADLGVATNSLRVEVPPHGVRLFRMQPHVRPLPSPPGPPPPHPSCPADFSSHAGGYWHNLEFMGKGTGTVAECAAKCRNSTTKDCVAFEVFLGGGYPGDCYNFLRSMSPPFTVAQSVTCVKRNV